MKKLVITHISDLGPDQGCLGIFNGDMEFIDRWFTVNENNVGRTKGVERHNYLRGLVLGLNPLVVWV